VPLFPSFIAQGCPVTDGPEGAPVEQALPGSGPQSGAGAQPPRDADDLAVRCPYCGAHMSKLEMRVQAHATFLCEGMLSLLAGAAGKFVRCGATVTR